MTLIDAGNGSPAGVDVVHLTRIGAVFVEMEGEEIPPRVICAIFQIGGGKPGNNFLRRGDRVLQLQ